MLLTSPDPFPLPAAPLAPRSIVVVAVVVVVVIAGRRFGVRFGLAMTPLVAQGSISLASFRRCFSGRVFLFAPKESKYFSVASFRRCFSGHANTIVFVCPERQRRSDATQKQAWSPRGVFAWRRFDVAFRATQTKTHTGVFVWPEKKHRSDADTQKYP